MAWLATTSKNLAENYFDILFIKSIKSRSRHMNKIFINENFFYYVDAWWKIT